MKAANTCSTVEPLRSVAPRRSTGSYNKGKKKEIKPFTAGCLILLLEEDTVYMLACQGAVGGWE